MWVTRRKLKKKINNLEDELSNKQIILDEALRNNLYLLSLVSEYKEKYPFELGQTVYDLQLRSASGRYTKTKPSIEHSIINDVVVDKKNYFKLVERFEAHDVFRTFLEARAYLEAVCVE